LKPQQENASAIPHEYFFYVLTSITKAGGLFFTNRGG
jgi:hypothetical protein